MKTICLLSYWVMLSSSIALGQHVDSLKQNTRQALSKRIWQVDLGQTDPGSLAAVQQTSGLQPFPDRAIRLLKRRLQDQVASAIMVITMTACIDTASTDPVDIRLCRFGRRAPALRDRLEITSLPAKVTSPADGINGLFELCPNKQQLHQHSNSTDESTNHFRYLYNQGSDCAYLGRGYSLIVTKFFDRVQHTIHDIELIWSDPYGSATNQVVKVNGNSYLAPEQSYL